MNFKKGDLIVENIGDAYNLILLTRVKGNEGRGYILDGVSLTDDGFERSIHYNTRGEPYQTKHPMAGGEVDLNNSELIKEEV